MYFLKPAPVPAYVHEDGTAVFYAKSDALRFAEARGLRVESSTDDTGEECWVVDPS